VKLFQRFRCYKEKIMKIAILDDYQDVVRHCACFAMLKDHDVKVFNSSAVGIGQLAIRLAPFDALVLIRERTRFPAPCCNACRI
jgi:D-3-phosphoglycerate dehydrogenase